ncbi:hypothetical protein HZH66_005936 [Vespula vulgaris]|uniref:Uncharacterized protein n=1 Tax=Vespula vulgaris TaxID=7454 RepID=A0A834K7D3_VESVU|nr:hypothetical protein HZH66_005936 [Vespula vulgaris]
MKRRRGWTENGGTRIDLVRADTPKMMFFPKEKEDEGRSRDYILMISVSNDIILGGSRTIERRDVEQILSHTCLGSLSIILILLRWRPP